MLLLLYIANPEWHAAQNNDVLSGIEMLHVSTHGENRIEKKVKSQVIVLRCAPALILSTIPLRVYLLTL